MPQGDCRLPEPADRQVNQYTTTPFDTRSYDRNGNLIAINPGTPSARTFVYDFRNRLTSIVRTTAATLWGAVTPRRTTTRSSFGLMRIRCPKAPLQ